MLPELNPIELIFLGAVALIFIGPKDLPVVLRKIGEWTARMRGLAAEFRASFDEMARQSELDELRKEVEALRTGQFASAHAPDLQSHVDEINQHLSTPYWDSATPVYDTPEAEAAEIAALPPAPPEALEAVAKPVRKPRSKAERPPVGEVETQAAVEPPAPARKRAPKAATSVSAPPENTSAQAAPPSEAAEA